MQIDLHAETIPVSKRLRAFAARVFSASLRPFSRWIRSVSARLNHRPSPAGGVQFDCVVRVPLLPEGTLVVEGSARSPHDAIVHAAQQLLDVLRSEGRRAAALPAYASR